jgi:elongation factor G
VKGLDANGTEITRKPDGPLSAFVFRTTIDPYAGKLSFVRVFSGTVKPDLLAAVDGKSNQKLGVLLEISGKNTKPITELTAGMIGALSKMVNLGTGDTISDPASPIRYPLLVIPEPVMSLALSPKSKQDEDKMSGGLDRIVQEDPTISVRRDPETHETVISGMGEIHIDVVLSRLKSRSGIEVETKTPRVAYRETVRQESSAQGRHKKQTGGRGQFGDVWLKIEPLPRSAGLEFVDKVVGGSVPGKFIPAVEKGVVETMGKGIIAGYQVVDIRVTLYDGSYHTVDSSEIAFKLAARKALRNAFEMAKPCLLEPIYSYDIVIPDEFYGSITADLSSKRGRILGSETKGKLQVVKALVPLAEMFRYCIDLRSMTGGQGTFTARFDHYEEVPQEVAKKVIEEAAKTREEEEEE